MKKIIYLHLLLTLLAFSYGCKTTNSKNAAGQFYTLQDYYSVPKYDVHIHIFTKSPFFPESCKKENYRLLSVNVNAPDLPSVEEQQEMAREIDVQKRREDPEFKGAFHEKKRTRK